MTLHPDVLTDLVILYHAGEASQATRALLDDEATRNPQLAAALASPARPIPLLPAQPVLDERRILRRVRLRYQAIAFAAVWFFALIAVAIFPRFLPPGPAWSLAITILPLALLALFATGGLGALYFLIRARR